MNDVKGIILYSYDTKYREEKWQNNRGEWETRNFGFEDGIMSVPLYAVFCCVGLGRS